MAKFTRRQVLLGGLAVSVVATGIRQFLRLKAQAIQQAEITDLVLGSSVYQTQALESAYDADKVVVESIEEINASVTLQPPTVPYSREMSKQLIQCSRLSTEQYLTGKYDLSYEGAIATLPTYSDRFAAYTQVASIIGPEEANVQEQVELTEDNANEYVDPLKANFDQAENLIRGLAGQSVTLKWASPVYWGFVLTSPEASILVYRGTQRGNEWLQTVNAVQIRPEAEADFKFIGKVHNGFAKIYSELAEPTLAAVRQLDPSVPLYITGHSLGSPLATLAAMDIALRVPEIKEQIRLYSYAGPRTGDPEFAEAHSQLIPNTYRVINLADPTVMVPPTSAVDVVYAHVGQVWSFPGPGGDIALNHFVSTYRTAIENEAETLVVSN